MNETMNETKATPMEKLATFIVDKRNLFFLLYIFALVFCIFSTNWVNVENDITKLSSGQHRDKAAVLQ